MEEAVFMGKRVRTGIGQDSHRFLPADATKPCVIGGVVFEGIPGFNANSDGDILFHALCNALTSIHGVLIMGGVADDLCLKDGITDSEVYVREALLPMGAQSISHVAFTIEAKRPRILEKRREICENVARVLGVDVSCVGLTATSGEGLTDFGCGDGAQCFCVLTTEEADEEVAG